jgi:putative ABC transport system substrate-binding protein
MRRRSFIFLLAAVASRSFVARAQQSERPRRVGILLPAVAGDRQWQSRVEAFHKAFALSGWTPGRNVQIEIRWATASGVEIRKEAAELAALAPDVILACGTSSVGPLLQATRSTPVVFTIVNDPVGAGFVESLAKPGGNATGFMLFEFSMSGKWLEVLKQVAPSVTRVAVLRDATQTSAISMFAAIQAVAPALGIEIIPLNMRDAGEIERSVEAFARVPNGGLIPMASAAAVRHRELIITLAARYKLPAVYWDRFFVDDGGLISYGPDVIDEFRKAARYVDRILKGERPADLPVQLPTKLETVINLKTAKALRLTVPPAILARADEVIE